MDKYKLQITGSSLRYFFNYLIREKIKFYSIDKTKNSLIVVVSKEDYLKIKKLKTTCTIQVLNRFGVIKIHYLVYKYRYLLLFFLLGLFLILFCSSIIFEVEVVHSKEEIRTLLSNDLSSYGIKKFNFIKSYEEKEEIKKKILALEKEKIEWLEIDRVGTKYIVHVEERKKRKKEENVFPRDIIAKKDAMILTIEAEAGEVVKKKYDYVNKGDMIISGTIKNKEEEMSKIQALGTIFGEVWYKVQVEIPKKYHEEVRTGKEKRVLSLVLLDKSFSFTFNKFNQYDEEKNYILKHSILPIGISQTTRYEKKVTDKEYTIHNIDQKALSFAKEKFNKKDILLEKVLKKTDKDSKIIVEVFLKVREDITDYRKIEDLELKKEEMNE